MEIRYISEDDSRYDISRVYEQSWKHAYKGIIPQDFLDSIPEGRWASSLDDDGRYNLVLTDGDKIVGTTCFCRSRWEKLPDHGEIVSLYLLPEYVGKGYGKMLLKRVIKELRGLGFNDILLWTLDKNRHARIFYEMNGFRFGCISQDEDIGGITVRELLYTYKGEKR